MKRYEVPAIRHGDGWKLTTGCPNCGKRHKIDTMEPFKCGKSKVIPKEQPGFDFSTSHVLTT